MKKFRQFETDRLVLRPTDESDAEFLLKLMNTPKWLKYIGDRKVRSEEDARNYIKDKIFPQLVRLGFANYTVIRKSDKVRLGTCGLYERPGLEGVDLGFAFLPEHEKQGYGLEAATVLRDAAFMFFKLKKLKAITNEHNEASQRLLRKLKFRPAGTWKTPDSKEELLLFELSAL